MAGHAQTSQEQDLGPAEERTGRRAGTAAAPFTKPFDFFPSPTLQHATRDTADNATTGSKSRARD